MPTMEETGLGIVDHANVVAATKEQYENDSKRSSYVKYTENERFMIGKYSNENGSAAATRKFRTRFPNLNESTVRGFQKKYRAKLHEAAKQGKSIEKKGLGGDIKRGRPLLLGPIIDEDVRKFVSALRFRGGRVSFSIAIAAAKVLVERKGDEGLRMVKFGKDWAQSLFRRMGFKKRSATTGKVIIPEGARKEAEILYLYDIVTKIEKYRIPSELVFNLDQTPSKYVQCSRYTMEKEGKKSVSIVGSGDKRAITATFVIDLKGNFLPMQLIYGGKTNRSIPRIDFPEGFSLSANPKHYSNTAESIKIIEEIIVPRTEFQRKKLNLSPDAPALLIMDVFRGQMTSEVMDLLAKENILVSCVPNNMTHLFQPLDLTVNSWAKRYMKEKFASWYAQKIREGLDSGIKIVDIDIKTQLTVMKPLHAKWLIDLYNDLTSAKGKEVVIGGWRASGILRAVEEGANNLPTLDPFADLEPLALETNVEEMLTINSFPEPGHMDVNERNIDSDSEFEYEEDDENSEEEDEEVEEEENNENDRNVFDFIVSNVKYS